MNPKLRSTLYLILLSALVTDGAVAQPQEVSCAVPILRTHTNAPYPVAAARSRERGEVSIAVKLGALGIPAGAKTVKSSGFTDLDEAAATWVKTKWRWEPPSRSCRSVRVLYRWTLYFDPCQETHNCQQKL
jgi:TonB family protein